MKAIRELVRMSLDKTFVLQFVSQRGLVQIMHMIASQKANDPSRLMLAAGNMLNVLGATTRRHRLTQGMYEEAVRALPVIVKAVGYGENLTKLRAIQLINALLKRCQDKPRSDMIKCLLTPTSEEALQRFKEDIKPDEKQESGKKK